MLAGLFGFFGFVLALFVVGAFMEGNLRKMAGYGAGLVVCVILMLTLTDLKPSSYVTECFTDWDGRSNSPVCN